MTGFMNTLGNLGGMVGPLVVGLAVQRWQSWSFAFYVTALVYASGAAAWLVIDPTRPIEDRRVESRPT
jgi:MFS family permease